MSSDLAVYAWQRETVLRMRISSSSSATSGVELLDKGGGRITSRA